MNIQVRVITAQAQARIRALEAEIAALNAGMRRGNAASAGFGAAALAPLQKFGNQLQWTGRQLQYNFTLPIVLAGAAAAKFALDNEKAFTKIAKVYGDATLSAKTMQNELASLKKAFVGLSNHYGVQQKEVLDVAAAWAAAGASGVALAKGVDQTLRTMVLGEMKSAEATDALIAIQAQYNLSTSELTDTIAKLNIIENQTGISLAGLVQGFARAAGTARSAGIDVNHLGAFLAALTPAAGSAAQAGNALKTIISRLLSPTGEAVDILHAMNIETSDLAWKSANGSQRIELLSKKFHGLDDAQKAVVSSTLASRYQINRFDVLMDSVYKSVDNNTKSMGYYGKSLQATADRAAYLKQADKELRMVLESNPQKLKQIWVILQNAMADIIVPMIPVILMLADSLRAMAQGFRNLPPEIQKFITFGLLALALFGPLIRYLGSTITLLATLGWFFHGAGNAILFMTGYMVKFIKLPFQAAGAALGYMSLGLRAIVAVSSPVISALLGMAASFASFVVVAAGAPLRALLPIVTGTFMLMGRNIIAIWGGSLAALRALTAVGAGGIGAVWAVLSSNMLRTTRVLWSNVVALWTLGTRAIFLSTLNVFRAIIISTVGFFSRLGLLFRMGMLSLVASVRLGAYGILAVMRGLPALIMGAGPAIWRAFTLISAGIVGALTSPIGIAILATLGVLYFFRDQVSQLISQTVEAFYQLPQGVFDAMKAVVDIVKAAAKAVYEWFSYLNPFAHHSPSLVENVQQGMAAVVTAFGTLDQISNPIQNAYRDIIKFGNATAALKNKVGAGKVADDRANLKKVAPGSLDEFDRLQRDLAQLNGLLARLNSAMQSQQSVVDVWTNKLANANTQLDKAHDKLDKLQAVLDKANDHLNEAQNRLQTFANTPIKGMKAMQDQIFKNDMAQKKLRLEMLKMEEVTGPIEDVQSRMNKLRGEIELLQGTQTDLRNAGAGSDILNTYKNQIKGLKGQEDATQSSLIEYEKMSKALEKLQRQGEMLDLQNSLKFDPLTKAIQDAANAMKEMPFDQIMAGVNGAQADIKKYTIEVDKASKAVDRQKAVVDNLTNARDKVQARLDAETQKLDKLRKAYDSVNDAIQAINQSLNDMTSAAEEALRRAKELKDKALTGAAKNFADAKGGNFPDVSGTGTLGREGGPGDQSKLIDQFTQDLAKQTGKMLGGFDMFGPIKRKWVELKGWFSKNVMPVLQPIADFFRTAIANIDLGEPFRNLDMTPILKFGAIISDVFKTIVGWGKSLWRLFGPEVIQTFHNLVNGAKDLFKQVAPELVKFKDLLKPFVDAVGNVWTVLKPVLAVLGGAVLLVIKVVWSMLNDAIGPVFHAIGGILAGFIRIIRGVIEVVLGVLSGDWKLAWQGALDIVSGTWKIILSLISGMGKTILGLIKGFVTGIWDFFKWLWNELVGHSIIPDIVNGIVFWIKKLGDIPQWLYDHLMKPWVDKLKSWWSGSLKPFLSGMVTGFTGLIHTLGQLPGWLWDHSFKVISDNLQRLWSSWLRPKLLTIRDGFNTILHTWAAIAGWLYNNAFHPIYDRLNSVWTKYIKPLGNTMIRGFANIFNAIGNAIVHGVNIGIGAINKLIGGLNWIGSHVPGLNFSIGAIGNAGYNPWSPPQFARGGALPMSQVGAGFKTNGVRAIVGEGSSHPEFVIPTDPKYRSRAAGLMTQAAKELGISQFDKGGVLGNVWDRVKDTAGKAATSVRRGAVNAVFKPINKLMGPILSKIDNRMHLRDLVGNGVKTIQRYAAGIDTALPTGGGPVNPGLAGALEWAKSQAGKPYLWGSAGPNGYDCSGFMSAITNAILGKKNIFTRVGSTGTFPWPGFVPGPGAFMIGSRRGNPGHMAGTLNGVNVESAGGGVGVRYGSHARGAHDPLFTTLAHLKGYYRGGILGKGGDAPFDLLNPKGSHYLGRDLRKQILHSFDKGGYLRQGITATHNGSGGPEPVLTTGQWATMMRLADASASVGVVLPKLLKSASVVQLGTEAGRASVRLAGANARASTTVQGSSVGSTEIHFHGDLSFPNIKSGQDAERFISNLEVLARGA